VTPGVSGPAAMQPDAARSSSLRVPASPDVLRLIRLFATSLGRHVDLHPEAVEDLKLALTEVCSAAIESSHRDDDVITVTVSWRPDRGGIAVAVSASSNFSTGDGTSDDRGRLLDALGIELHPAEDGRGATFEIATGPGP